MTEVAASPLNHLPDRSPRPLTSHGATAAGIDTDPGMLALSTGKIMGRFGAVQILTVITEADGQPPPATIR